MQTAPVHADRRERRAGWLLALLSAIAVAIGVAPEVLLDAPDLNDSAYHVALALRADEAWQRGQSPIDFWYPDVALGFPLLRHYQHLPHIALAAAHRLTGGTVSIATLQRLTLGLLLALFPLSVFTGLRRVGLAPLIAGCAALAAPLLSTPHLYGLGFESYLWGGSGLYAQLVAVVLAPLALAEAYRAVSAGRGTAIAAVLIAATFISQLVYGYMVALSIPAFAILGPARRWRAARVAVLLAAAFLVGSYFFVPALGGAEFANHSVWEKPEKWDSLGAPAVLVHLITGRLFDSGRLPALSVLAAVGIVHIVWRGDAKLRLLAGLFVFWLLLYFGRPTWGRLIDLLPLVQDIPLHRFIGAVHLFGLVLIGASLAWLLRGIGLLRGGWRTAAAIGALACLVAAPVYERMSYLRSSLGWKRRAAAALAESPDVAQLMQQLKSLPDGRAYVGVPARKAEYLRIDAIPLTALCLLHGVDTLGFLWIPITFAGDVQVWFDPANELYCRIFGVRYLVYDQHATPPPFADLRHSIGRYRVYEVADASYFGVVNVPFAVPCTKRSVYDIGYAWLRTTLPGWQIYPALALGDRAPANIPRRPLNPNVLMTELRATASAPSNGATTLRQIGPWECEVAVARPMTVIRRCGYHPGLRATVDGVPSTVYPVVPGFAATDVPAGRHNVAFSYEPARHWPWWIGGALALVAAEFAARRLCSRASRHAATRAGPMPA